MANNRAALKRQRQSIIRREKNRQVKSRVRSATRKFKEAVSAQDTGLAATSLSEVLKLIDSSAGKGLYPKNTAARKKSRLSAMFNGMS